MWPLRDHHAHIANFSHMIFSQTAGVRSRWLCWSILLHQRCLTCTCACAYANTWPVYKCGFTYLGYPRKLKCKNVQSDQSSKVFTLESFSHYTVICHSNVWMSMVPCDFSFGIIYYYLRTLSLSPGNIPLIYYNTIPLTTCGKCNGTVTYACIVHTRPLYSLLPLVWESG